MGWAQPQELPKQWEQGLRTFRGRVTWTTKGVQGGTPSSTPSALDYVVGDPGQGKGVPKPAPSHLNSSGVGLGGQTLSLPGTESLGCQGSASLEPLITAPLQIPVSSHGRGRGAQPSHQGPAQ